VRTAPDSRFIVTGQPTGQARTAGHFEPDRRPDSTGQAENGHTGNRDRPPSSPTERGVSPRRLSGTEIAKCGAMLQILTRAKAKGLMVEPLESLIRTAAQGGEYDVEQIRTEVRGMVAFLNGEPELTGSALVSASRQVFSGSQTELKREG